MTIIRMIPLHLKMFVHSKKKTEKNPEVLKTLFSIEYTEIFRDRERERESLIKFGSCFRPD